MLTTLLYLTIGSIFALHASKQEALTYNAIINCVLLWPLVLGIWLKSRL